MNNNWEINKRITEAAYRIISLHWQALQDADAARLAGWPRYYYHQRQAVIEAVRKDAECSLEAAKRAVVRELARRDRDKTA